MARLSSTSRALSLPECDEERQFCVVFRDLESVAKQTFAFHISTMPHFEVPGWSVASAPVAEPVMGAGSKKRKRPTEDNDSPEPIDLQKLIKKHRKVESDGDDASTVSRGASRVKALGKSLVKKTMDRKRQRKTDALEEKKKTISLPKALTPSEKGHQMIAAEKSQRMTASSSSSSLVRPAKRPKRVHDEPVEKPLPTIPEDTVLAEPEASGTTAGLTALQQGMKRSLDGARFR